MNLDPDPARDHRLPRLPRRRSRRGRGAGLPAGAAWPTRSATTSRCCWSTRPGGRPERGERHGDLVRRVPPRRRGRAGRGRPAAARARRGRRPGPPRGGRGRRRRSPPRSSAARDAARPRAVVAAGPDSRLLRAVLEPWCPVPFVAWPGPALPGWAGGLDLVVVLAPDGADRGHRVRGRRGRTPRLPGRRRLPGRLAGRRARRRPLDARSLPTVTRDQLATAVVMLEYLDQVDLGPRADPERSPRRSTTWRSPARRTATSRSTPPRCWRSRWPTPTRSSGAARCWPPAPPAGSPSPSAGPAAARRSPATPSTCCR